MAKQSPRNLPTTSRRSGNFAPRRSFARARASREKVSSIDRMLRNQRSQAKFTRSLKIVVNIICIIGILGLIIYTIFMTQKPDVIEPKIFEKPEPLRQTSSKSTQGYLCAKSGIATHQHIMIS